jgi:hypothetical protein
MLTMTDDTTLTNPSAPKYDASTFIEDALITDFTQIASCIFNGKNEKQETRKIREDLVRDYISKPDSETPSTLKKIIRFLKG